VVFQTSDPLYTHLTSVPFTQTNLTPQKLFCMYPIITWSVDKLRGQRLGGMFTMLPHKQSCACATWEAAWCQQFCWVSNVLQNLLCHSDCSSVTSILLIAHKAPGTDHGNTVLQFRLAVSHPFYKHTHTRTHTHPPTPSLAPPQCSPEGDRVSDTSFTTLVPRLHVQVCTWCEFGVSKWDHSLT